jgi:hypothetical protein
VDFIEFTGLLRGKLGVFHCNDLETSLIDLGKDGPEYAQMQRHQA